MEQRVLANRRSANGDVELTLVATQMPEFGLRSNLRDTPSQPDTTATVVMQPEVTLPERQAMASPVYLFCKRVLDVVISLAALMVALLPMMLLAICIRLESPGSPCIGGGCWRGRSGMRPSGQKRCAPLMLTNSAP